MQKDTPTQKILNLWPTRRALADDLGKKLVVIHRWHQRSSIPSKYDARLLDAASARNIALNWRELMDARSVSCDDQAGHVSAESQGAEFHTVNNSD